MDRFIERAFETLHGWLAIGHESLPTQHAQLVRNRTAPSVYDANFAHAVRAGSASELDAFLAALETHFAGQEHRAVRSDPGMPPGCEARLLLEGFELAEVLVHMCLEDELPRPDTPVAIRAVETDTDWASLEDLLWQDHREEVDKGFHEAWQRELTTTMLSCKRVKATEVQYFLASHAGADCAFFSSWPGRNGIGKVEDLFTLPKYRGLGIATCLIAHCVADARRRGARSVLIGARPSDTPIHLYARLGFRPLCVERSYLKLLP